MTVWYAQGRLTGRTLEDDCLSSSEDSQIVSCWSTYANTSFGCESKKRLISCVPRACKSEVCQELNEFIESVGVEQAGCNVFRCRLHLRTAAIVGIATGAAIVCVCAFLPCLCGWEKVDQKKRKATTPTLQQANGTEEAMRRSFEYRRVTEMGPHVYDLGFKEPEYILHN